MRTTTTAIMSDIKSDEKPAPMAKQGSKLGDLEREESLRFDHDSLASKGKNVFLVAVDGSECAEMALEATLALKKKYDYVACFHAMQATKVIENPNFRPKHIQDHCENVLTPLMPKTRFGVCIEERGDRNFMATLRDNVSHYKKSPLRAMLAPTGTEYPDFVVFGAYGRKGVKTTPNTLGSNCARALDELPYPCIIMRKPIPMRARNFLFCVNNSEQSRKGLDILLKLTNPRDKLHLVHLVDSDSKRDYVGPMKEYYENELEEYGPVESKLTILDKPHGEIFTDAIVKFAEQEDFDFFCIAPRAKQHLSSVSNHIINHLKTSIILLKLP